MNKLSLFFYNLSRSINNPRKAFNVFKFYIKNKFFYDYYYNKMREPKIKGNIQMPQKLIKKIKSNLIKSGYKVVSFNVDINDYKKYMEKSNYQKYKFYYGGGKLGGAFTEKTLEHYIAAKLLRLNNKDIYIDIASASSPTPEIYQRLFLCKSYKQDLLYKKGLHDSSIGGDACNMPIKNGFATKMALHCSFEHFEGNADIKFIKEASRVIRKGGKLCILPLYLNDKYSIQTNPVLISKNLTIEKDTLLIAKKGSMQRHSRFYDVPHLTSRIKKNLKDFKLIIYFLNNEKEVDKNCYLKFVMLLEKK